MILSGTINIAAGGSALPKSFSATGTSFTTENTLCCPLPGPDTSASGILSLNATYGGNLFLEPASASISPSIALCKLVFFRRQTGASTQ